MNEISKAQELLIANLIYPLVKDLVLPKIQSIAKLLWQDDGFTIPQNFKNESIEIIEKYLLDKYTQFSILDTLAFPNMQTLFEQLYEPLSIYGFDSVGQEITFKIDKYPEEILCEYYRLLIEDSAGMGKSTITKKIFRSAIEEKKNIPIYIDLKNINNDNSIMDEVVYQLSSINESSLDTYFFCY